MENAYFTKRYMFNAGTKTVLANLIVALALVGCGGGGGGGNDTGDNQTTVDNSGNQSPLPSSTLNDSTPDAFSIAAKTNVQISSNIYSEIVTPSGFDTATSVSVTNGEYAIVDASKSAENQNYTNSASNLSPGQSLIVKQKSGTRQKQEVKTELTIGGVTASFNSTTKLTLTWSETLNLPAQSGAVVSFDATKNDDGSITATWHELDSATHVSKILTSTFSVGTQAWGNTETVYEIDLDSIAGLNTSDKENYTALPAIASEGENQFIVWRVPVGTIFINGSSSATLIGSWKNSDNSWSTPETVAVVGGATTQSCCGYYPRTNYPVAYPSIAADGTALVSYHSDTSQNSVVATTKAPSQSWQALTALTTMNSSTFKDRNAVIADTLSLAQNQFLVTWIQRDSSQPATQKDQLQVAAYTPTFGWNVTNIAAGADIHSLSLTSNSLNQVLLSWTKTDNSNGLWGKAHVTAITINESGGVTAADTQLATDVNSIGYSHALNTVQSNDTIYHIFGDSELSKTTDATSSSPAPLRNIFVFDIYDFKAEDDVLLLSGTSFSSNGNIININPDRYVQSYVYDTITNQVLSSFESDTIQALNSYSIKNFIDTAGNGMQIWQSNGILFYNSISNP